MINLIFFITIIMTTVTFTHPVYVTLSFIVAFIYSISLNGLKSVILNSLLVVFVFIYAGIYAYYNHFGVTAIRQNIVGNTITLESIVFGLVLGMMIAAVIMWLSCLIRIFTADKVVYLLGRLSPKLSLFVSILIRTVPKVKAHGRRINISQRGIGRGIGDGNVYNRLCNTIRLISILITWTLESFVESSRSMNSRGYLLKGRTAFSIYRFDNRDRCFVLIMFVFIISTAMAALLNQTTILYDPEIIFNRQTPISYLFYMGYFFLLTMPIGTEIMALIHSRIVQKNSKIK